MRITLKKILEMDIEFGTPIEITMKKIKERKNSNSSINDENIDCLKNKHIGYYLYASRKHKGNKIISIIEYYAGNNLIDVDMSKIKEVKILEYKK